MNLDLWQGDFDFQQVGLDFRLGGLDFQQVVNGLVQFRDIKWSKFGRLSFDISISTSV